MEAKEYLKVNAALIAFGRTMRDMDLTSFIEQLEKAEKVTPPASLDIARYRVALKNISALKKVALAGKLYQTAFNESVKVIVEPNTQN